MTAVHEGIASFLYLSHIVYIFIAIALDETGILVAVHFSMKNIC